LEYELEEKVKMIAEWLFEKKADNILTIDVRDKCNFTEYLVICTGMATMHNQAIADYVVDKARENKMKILSKEGLQASVWVLIDLNDVIVHIFTEEIRNNYRLEDLWTKKIPTENIVGDGPVRPDSDKK